MSALAPASFVDDGVSFTKRTRHGLRPSQIADWLNDTESSTASCSTAAYTGSFVDDGADMLLPPAHGPRFGPIDARFYKQKKRNEGEESVWNDAVQQAVSGDIQRSLAHIRGLGDIVVRKRDGVADGKDSKEQETVTVPVPRKWGPFVIRCDDGRVIVIDETGEYDSGPQGGEEKRREGTRWIKAPSTVEPLSLGDGIVDAEEKGKQARREGKKDESHRRKKTHRQLLSPSAEPLTTIQESEYEDGYEVSYGEDPVSPTGFFMTGGASGWPSRAPTSVASPARAGSHKLSMPGSWPSPAQRPAKSAARSQQSSGDDSLCNVDKRSRSERSERLDESKKSGRARRSHKHRADVVSAKSYSTYKSPAVEDAPSISSQSVHGYKRTGWGGSTRDEDDWKGAMKASKKGSHVSWDSSMKINLHGWGASGKAASKSSWDGYEKRKTASEVSVAGSGSERSALSSHAPSRGSGRGRASKMGSGVQKGWNGSAVSKKRRSSKKAEGDDDGWGVERSKGGWTGWK